MSCDLLTFTQANGYRQETDKFCVTWITISLQDKINRIDHDESRDHCQEAYDYLTSEYKSWHSRFFPKRNIEKQTGKKLLLRLRATQRPRMRFMAICILSKLGTKLVSMEESHLSSKVSLMYKVISEIADCSMAYKLLHFHYDLWLWQTLTAAIAAGRKKEMFSKQSFGNKVVFQ